MFVLMRTKYVRGLGRTPAAPIISSSNRGGTVALEQRTGGTHLSSTHPGRVVSAMRSITYRNLASVASVWTYSRTMLSISPVCDRRSTVRRKLGLLHASTWATMTSTWPPAIRSSTTGGVSPSRSTGVISCNPAPRRSTCSCMIKATNGKIMNVVMSDLPPPVGRTARMSQGPTGEPLPLEANSNDAPGQASDRHFAPLSPVVSARAWYNLCLPASLA